jgi:hypothetical protein
MEDEARAWANGLRSYCGVVVTVGRADVELAQASLWSIDCDESSPEASAATGRYLASVADEAIAEARDKLVTLGRDRDEETSGRHQASVGFTFGAAIPPVQIADLIASCVEHRRGSIEAGGMISEPLEVDGMIVGRVDISIPPA